MTSAAAAIPVNASRSVLSISIARDRSGVLVGGLLRRCGADGVAIGLLAGFHGLVQLIALPRQCAAPALEGIVRRFAQGAGLPLQVVLAFTGLRGNELTGFLAGFRRKQQTDRDAQPQAKEEV